MGDSWSYLEEVDDYMKEDKGQYLEKRIHTFFWMNGYFVRRNIKMILNRGKEVTDIDIYAIKFDEFLRPMRVAVECKNLEGGFDSILKLRGISDYYHVDIPIIIRKKIDTNTHDFINHLGMMGITLSHLEELEKHQTNSGTALNLYDLNQSAKEIAILINILSNNKNSKEVYWRSIESWMIKDPFRRFIFHQIIHESIKDIISTISDERLFIALQYSSWNNFLNSALTCIEMASILIEIPNYHRKKKLLIKLMGGEISILEKRKLIGIVQEIIKTSGIPIDENLFNIEPSYMNRLNDFIIQLIQSPHQCQKYIRFLDYLINGQLILNRKVDNSQLSEGMELKNDLIQKFSKWNYKLVEVLDESGGIPKYMTELL